MQGGSSSAAVVLGITLLLPHTFVPNHVGAETSSCSISTFVSSDAPKSIPDPGSAESALVLPAGDPVAALAVRLTISHPFDSDLKLELVSPAGKVVILAEAIGMWGRDFTDTVFDDEAPSSVITQLPPFTGPLRPAEALSAFAGSQRAGTWKLRATDLRGLYAGQLRGWSLDVRSCGASLPSPRVAPAGAPEPPALPTNLPAGRIPVEGTLLTVTTESDASNGNVSSVATLQANPGSDGISFREAIEATNNDPGTYTIRFDVALARATITVGVAKLGFLPPLTGGGTSIDGDIDGDGRPDVTIASQLDDPCLCGWGLNVASGRNRLHALALRGFSNPVWFTAAGRGQPGALPSRKTFASNTVSGLVLSDVRQKGIWINPVSGVVGAEKCIETGCQTYNRWVDTRFVGNTIEFAGTTIESNKGGIEVELVATAGESVERLTVAGNRISMPSGALFGINLSIGGGGGANENRISDAIAAYNSVDARGRTVAINAFSGLKGGSANTLEDIRIIANRVQVSAPSRANGIHIAMSDGCTGEGGQGICSKDNVARRIQILGNSLHGQDEGGIVATYPCCGPGYNGLLTDVRIAGNVIKGVVPPGHPNPWGIEIGTGASNVANVIVDGNTIEQQTIEPGVPHAAYLAAGGIAILGGMGKGSSSIRAVSVTNNRIDTDLVGITVVGGGPDPYGDVANEATDNKVSGIDLRGNVIGRAPVLAARWEPGIKGISVIGGLGPAPNARPLRVQGNSVVSVILENNQVAGVTDDVFVRPNFGAGVTGNVASAGTRSSCSATVDAGSVEQRIAEFWRRVNALGPSEHLTAADLGQWAVNLVDRDPSAAIAVADFRASTAAMQAALERAAGGTPGTPRCADVEQRVARFWQRVDALLPRDLLTATDIGQWALNVTDRDPSARMRVDDFRVTTGGMQAALDRAAVRSLTQISGLVLQVSLDGFVPV